MLIERLAGGRERLVLEPGRRIVGNAGLLLTRVEYTKVAGERTFALVDAAMNDLMRLPVRRLARGACGARGWQPGTYDIAGLICESGDVLARDRALALDSGSLLAILSAGAYGSSMSSNYNSRARAAEVMVDGDQAHLIRRREAIADLWALEQRLPWIHRPGEQRNPLLAGLRCPPCPANAAAATVGQLPYAPNPVAEHHLVSNQYQFDGCRAK